MWNVESRYDGTYVSGKGENKWTNYYTELWRKQ